MKVEYSMPSECGNRISRSSVMVGAAAGRRSPWPTVSVAHSPTPSAVRIAARLRRRGEERRGRVRLVVAGEQDLLARHAELRRDDAAHPDLFAQRVLHRVRKRPPGVRERAQRAGQDPVELQHAALVEHHGVEVVRLEPGVLQAPFDRRQRKAASFLRRDSRSSWTAHTGTPSTTSAAAES